MNCKAYLIVICDSETNAVQGAAIWSSPEWEQSRCLNPRTYVAYAVGGADYTDAREKLLQAIAYPQSRYHWLLQHLKEDLKPVAEPCRA